MSSEKVENALSALLPSPSQFDSSSFDPVRYINSTFPDEQSLQNVDKLYLKVRRQIESLNRELHNSVRDQSMTNHTQRIDLETSRATIRQLFKHIEAIQEKASQAESLVEQITRDIKVLDSAKKNLTLTISTFQKLQMFVASIGKLFSASKQKDYKTIADQLLSINSFMDFFEQYKHIPKIEQLVVQVTELKASLRLQTSSDFQRFMQQTEERQLEKASNGRQICQVITGLGREMKDKLLDEFINKQMEGYHRTFGKKGNTGLEKISKRYKWMRRMLQQYKRHQAEIFPPAWQVDALMVVQFCILTLTEIKQYLTEDKSLSPQSLVRAIRSTLQFEQEMHRKFHQQTQWEYDRRRKELEEELKSLKEKKSQMRVGSSVTVSARYQIIRQIQTLEKELERVQKDEKKRVGESGLPDGEAATSSSPSNPNHIPRQDFRFLGMISKCFENHMKIYLDFERQNMSEKIVEFVSKEQWDPFSQHHSGEDLFIYIEESLKNCKTISTGQTLFSLLTEVWKPQILFYSTKLVEKLPKLKNSSKDTGFKITSLVSTGQTKVNLTSDDFNRVCHILLLSKYCRSELDHCQKFVVASISDMYKKKVSFKSEHTKFYQLEKACISLLCLNIINEIETASFAQMLLKNNWSAHSVVDDESEYVSSIVDITKNGVKKFIGLVKWDSYKMFCNSFVIKFASAYYNAIYRCRKISNFGLQQFLLDVASLISFLSKMVEVHDEFEDNDEYGDVFLRKVHEQMNRVSAIFKVLMAPRDSLIQTYRSIFPKGSQEHLDKILDLKAIEKEEKSSILGTFSSMTKSILNVTKKK